MEEPFDERHTCRAITVVFFLIYFTLAHLAFIGFVCMSDSYFSEITRDTFPESSQINHRRVIVLALGYITLVTWMSGSSVWSRNPGKLKSGSVACGLLSIVSLIDIGVLSGRSAWAPILGIVHFIIFGAFAYFLWDMAKYYDKWNKINLRQQLGLPSLGGYPTASQTMQQTPMQQPPMQQMPMQQSPSQPTSTTQQQVPVQTT